MMVCLVNLVLPRSIQGPTHSCSNDSNGHSNFTHENRLYDFCHDFDYNLGRMLYKVPNLAMNGG